LKDVAEVRSIQLDTEQGWMRRPNTTPTAQEDVDDQQQDRP
jgi:hypothetical protein